MDPIIGNSLSNNCDNPISSNCVTWAGNQVDGLCPGVPLTDVVQIAINNSTPATSCYTGTWVDFSAFIPTSGVGTGFSWVISNIGFSGTEEGPQYKWTRDGDLSVRGAFRITITPGVVRAFIDIPLYSVSTTCLPSGFKTQSILVAMDEVNAGQSTAVIHAELILNPSGTLVIEISYVDFPFSPIIFDIDLGGTRFNVA